MPKQLYDYFAGDEGVEPLKFKGTTMRKNINLSTKN